MNQSTVSAVQSADRIFQIIELLSRHPKGLALVEVCRETSLAKATASRLLSSIVAHGYAVHDEGTRRYRLSMKMFQLGSRVADSTNILSSARSYLDELAHKTGETVHLVTKLGDEVVYLYKEEGGSSLVRTASFVGLKSPMYCTGVGKSILAHLPLSQVKEIWERTDIVKHTDTTIVDFDKFVKELEEIRSKGYALDNEEHEMGVCCVAVVIKDVNNSPLGAISVSVPTQRLSEDLIQKLAPVVMSTANKISSSY